MCAHLKYERERERERERESKLVGYPLKYVVWDLEYDTLMFWIKIVSYAFYLIITVLHHEIHDIASLWIQRERERERERERDLTSLQEPPSFSKELIFSGACEHTS